MGFYILELIVKDVDNIDRNRNSLHTIAPYVGKVRPGLASFLISLYGVEGKAIYDPFCGSGSILLEGWIKGFNVVGCDLNQYAYYLSQAKLNPPKNIEEVLKRLEQYNEIVKISLLSNRVFLTPAWITEFFHPQTLQEINTWVDILINSQEWFVLICLMGILHHQRPGFLSYPSSHGAPYLRNNKYPKNEYPEMYEYRNVYERLYKKLERSLKSLPQLDYSVNRTIINSDSLKVDISKRNIGTIITSPPYMKALSYARDNRMRLHFLGVDDWQTLDSVISPNKSNFIDLLKRSLNIWAYNQKKGDKCILIIGEINIVIENKKLSLASFIINTANDSYRLIDIFIDPIPESKKVVKGNNSISKECIIVLERK